MIRNSKRSYFLLGVVLGLSSLAVAQHNTTGLRICKASENGMLQWIDEYDINGNLVFAKSDELNSSPSIEAFAFDSLGRCSHIITIEEENYWLGTVVYEPGVISTFTYKAVALHDEDFFYKVEQRADLDSLLPAWRFPKGLNQLTKREFLDSLGKPLCEVSFDWDRDTAIVTAYHYDVSGKKDLIRVIGYIDGKRQTETDAHIQYDPNGYVQRQIDIYLSDKGSDTLRVYTRTYNTGGQIQIHLRCTNAGFCEETTYEYNTSGQVVTEKLHEQGKPHYMTTYYEYDSRGNVTKQTGYFGSTFPGDLQYVYDTVNEYW